MVWRWASTMRRDSIQRVPGPTGSSPAYRIEVRPTDHQEPGTCGDHPRAELLSVDNEEKHRRQPPPATGALRDGNEYWATFAFYLDAGFPTNHWWATLFQRKMDDPQAELYLDSWFSINVHMNKIDATVPGRKPDKYTNPIGSLVLDPELPHVVGRWVQVLVHEKLSSKNDGFAYVYIDDLNTPLTVVEGQPTVPAGDVIFHFQYGYYRANEPKPPATNGRPGTGVVFYTPLLFKRGQMRGTVPSLP